MILNNNIISLDTPSIPAIAASIASKVKERRLEKNLTQEGLALRADIKLPTYRKFEHTGEISLKGLLKISFALDMLDDFDNLFSRKQYSTIEEALSDKQLKRKRGKKI